MKTENLLLLLGAFILLKSKSNAVGLMADYSPEANKKLKVLAKAISTSDKKMADNVINMYKQFNNMTLPQWQKLENLVAKLPDVVIAYLALKDGKNIEYVSRKILTQKGII